MSTTMKNSEVMEAYAAAAAIGERTTHSILGALAVRRLLRALRPLVEDIRAVQTQLVQDHCEKDAKGAFIPLPGEGGLKLRDDAKEEYHRQFKELMDATAVVPAWVTAKHFEGVEVSGGELAALGELLREDDGN